jgi:F0F1-type ATP synthase assembly protein I
MLIGGVGFGVLAGYLLDRRFGTGPWLLVTGSVLGMTTGFIGFFKRILQLGKRR